MKTLTIYFLILFLILTLGCQIEVNVEAEEASVETLLDKYSDAWKTMDIKKFEEIFSNDENLAIFDMQTRYVGWEAWRDILMKYFESTSNVNVSFKEHSIHIHPSGNIAWLSVLEDADWIEEGQPVKVEGGRATWILEKRNDNWVVVQGHWSVPQKVISEDIQKSPEPVKEPVKIKKERVLD
jgi:ketosteroid isomerase-like protein